MATSPEIHITIETSETIVVWPVPDSFRAWCEQCLEVVGALSPESVTGVLQIPTSTIYELLAGGQLHVVEVGGLAPLICSNSLSAASTQNQLLIEGERQ